MKNRKPFELKNTLIIYNAVQVVLSVIIVIEVSMPDRNVINFICSWKMQQEKFLNIKLKIFHAKTEKGKIYCLQLL
jgi:hypothetical protein